MGTNGVAAAGSAESGAQHVMYSAASIFCRAWSSHGLRTKQSSRDAAPDHLQAGPAVHILPVTTSSGRQPCAPAASLCNLQTMVVQSNEQLRRACAAGKAGGFFTGWKGIALLVLGLLTAAVIAGTAVSGSLHTYPELVPAEIKFTGKTSA
jgi:hypothetical protein